ncbi:poly-gamma-glutamate hydrolase family protein [Bacillus inaquosorum]|uniref:poly-gamma-glutamate hydrolase family protein n=1 Tax=Bacillus inaquosorum TaxID=483913 RepID=UPI00248483AE|nr:poly-gamma-glutamate hydrolase family protein [Bacillus inaquosorum]
MYLFEGLEIVRKLSAAYYDTHFDEPRALKMTGSHEYVISFARICRRRSQIEVGGTDRVRAADLVEKLKMPGFRKSLFRHFFLLRKQICYPK